MLALSILNASNTSKSDDLTVMTLLHVPNVLHTFACKRNKHIYYIVRWSMFSAVFLNQLPTLTATRNISEMI